MIDNQNFRGRPVAAWISIYGEDAKPEIAAIRKNPDYLSMDAKKRKPLVERMGALQGQLHRG